MAMFDPWAAASLSTSAGLFGGAWPRRPLGSGPQHGAFHAGMGAQDGISRGATARESDLRDRPPRGRRSAGSPWGAEGAICAIADGQPAQPAFRKMTAAPSAALAGTKMSPEADSRSGKPFSSSSFRAAPTSRTATA